MEKKSDELMNRGLHKSMEGREDVVEVRCTSPFLRRVTFASLGASNPILLGCRSLHSKALNTRLVVASKDGAALRCAV